MKIFGIAGWSGSGKTTLLVSLLPALIARGVSVSTIKHTHASIDLDQPGKDTFRHRAAGATEVMLVSSRRWTLMHEFRDGEEPAPEVLLRSMSPVDLLLVEGFRALRHDKLEVYRPVLGKPMLCSSDPSIVAVASDPLVTGLEVPVLPLADAGAIAAFIIARCGLAASRA